MNDDERQMSTLLHALVPDPPVGVDYDRVAAAARRRRTASWLVPVGAAAAVATLVGAAVTLNRDPEGSGGTAAGPADRGVVNDPLPSTGQSTAASPRVDCPVTKDYPAGTAMMIDWVPFVQLGGRQFLADFARHPSTRRADLGAQVGTVNCNISDLSDSGQEIVGDFKDGNAAFLPIGAKLYAVDGFDPGCRVAAIEEGKARVYLAQRDGGRHAAPRPCAVAGD